MKPCLLLAAAAAALVTTGAAAQSPEAQAAAMAGGAVPSRAAPAKAVVCADCHGADGRSTDTTKPILAGQTARYLYVQLRDFQGGRRVHVKMSQVAADLSREEMLELANWFASQKPLPQNFQVDAEKAKLGKAKSDETLCTMCHMGGFAGQNEVPRVAGQHYDYVVKQLHDFKARHRTNDAGNMTSVASTLSDADIENLAHYITGL